jgi:threonylcarbamoyladenosine tRNA methylthiotransferase CDKAL1
MSIYQSSADKKMAYLEDQPISHSKISTHTFPVDDTATPPKNLKVWVEGYGCTSSLGDSETIRGLLKEGGYGLGKNEIQSSLNIIVTCSVKDTTEHRMLHRISELVNTGKPLIVAGCLPKANKDLIEAMFPSASLLGPQALDKTLDTVKKAVEGQRAIMLQDSGTNKILLPRLRLNPIVSIIEIASGCVSLCSFCQTKLAKGQLRSHRIGDITRRIRNDVQEGCKEIWLSSTDNGCYGRDIGSDLVDLLESCVAVRGDFKIRIGMMNPMYLPALKKRLIRILFDDNNIFKFLHIPLQSGSDLVLRKMMRGHTSKTFVDVVKEIRAEIPALTLATDVIVGFPTETDEDFRRTLEVVEITEPDIINISKYSARPGTKAARLKKINSELIKERTKMMHTLANKIGLKRNSRWLKWEGEIVIDSRETKRLAGRNYAYKPIHIATSDDESVRLGDNLFVRIEGITSHVLTGSVI